MLFKKNEKNNIEKFKGIVVLNKNKKVSLKDLTYKENLIIKYTKEKFNDEDPCIIHRTQAIMALTLELQNILNEKHLKIKEVSLEKQNIPKDILEYIILDDSIETITFS